MTINVDDIPTNVWSNVIFDEADPRLVNRFKQWITQNPHILQMFEYVAEDTMVRKGLKRYSAWVIINVARWEHDTKKSEGKFQINNDFIAPLSRLLVALRPEFKGFFGLRIMKHRRKTLPPVVIDPSNDRRQTKLPLTNSKP
jgi:hypothetical protein